MLVAHLARARGRAGCGQPLVQKSSTSAEKAWTFAPKTVALIQRIESLSCFPYFFDSRRWSSRRMLVLGIYLVHVYFVNVETHVET